jgi:hypothetical protein
MICGSSSNSNLNICGPRIPQVLLHSDRILADQRYTIQKKKQNLNYRVIQFFISLSPLVDGK